MSVSEDTADKKSGDDSPPTCTQNSTINVTAVRTVKVSNISQSASEDDIKEFFSFSGNIHFIEMQKESETTQLAYVTFKDPKGADTAMLLTGAVISNLAVSITLAKDYNLPSNAPPLDLQTSGADAVKKAEDVVSSMLAKGFILGKDAVNKAKSFDESYHLTSNASATVASVDQKMGISEKLSIGTAVVNEKVKEMDQKYRVLERAKSALSVAEQKKSAIMSNPYVSAGASLVSTAYAAVAKAAEDVSTLTKEKVEKAEEERRTAIGNDSAPTHLDGDSAPAHPNQSAVVPVHSADSNKTV